MAKQIQIPIFDINVEDEAFGLFGLSFVDNPAIQVEMHYFKDEAKKVYFSSNEKREVVSPVIIPNQLIYREADGLPYYMRASADTIKQMYEKYMLSGKWNNFTYMHENIDAPMEERALDGIYLQRLWIIEDENDDAFTKYGFENLPKGTMMMKCRVNNRQIWKEIKEGNLRGISLEALFKKVSTNKALQITYSKMKDTLNLFQKFVAFLNEVSQEAEGIADEAKKDETNSGEVTLKYYLDDEHYFEVDAEGFVRDENGEKVKEGEYKLADGNVFTVSTDGKFVGTNSVDESTGEEQIEAPIAEGFEKQDEKEDEETKDEDGKADEESDGETSEATGENTDEDVKPADEDSGEKDEEKDDEELEEEKPLVNAFPFEINGSEFLLPEEVIDYIKSLQTEKIEVEEKLTEMQEQTPSAMPIGAVVKNGVETDSVNDRIQALNAFKNWRENR